MERAARWMVLAAIGSLALGAAHTGVAQAHGVCKATASPPVPAVLVVSYAGAYDCSDNHGNLYVEACLQKSLSPLTGWETVACTSAHAMSGNHVHAVGTATDICLVGYYRTTAFGYNGNFNHYNSDASAPVACAAR